MVMYSLKEKSSRLPVGNSSEPGAVRARCDEPAKGAPERTDHTKERANEAAPDSSAIAADLNDIGVDSGVK